MNLISKKEKINTILEYHKSIFPREMERKIEEITNANDRELEYMYLYAFAWMTEKSILVDRLMEFKLEFPNSLRMLSFSRRSIENLNGSSIVHKYVRAFVEIGP